MTRCTASLHQVTPSPCHLVPAPPSAPPPPNPLGPRLPPLRLRPHRPLHRTRRPLALRPPALSGEDASTPSCCTGVDTTDASSDELAPTTSPEKLVPERALLHRHRFPQGLLSPLQRCTTTSPSCPSPDTSTCAAPLLTEMAAPRSRRAGTKEPKGRFVEPDPLPSPAFLRTLRSPSPLPQSAPPSAASAPPSVKFSH